MHAVSEIDGRLEVQVTVTALAARRIDEAAVRGQIAGKTVAEARDALKDLGEVVIDLWPAWVDRLPQLDFRIEIVPEVRAPTGSSGETPAGSGN
jgi:hypothetical protein